MISSYVERAMYSACARTFFFLGQTVQEAALPPAVSLYNVDENRQYLAIEFQGHYANLI